MQNIIEFFQHRGRKFYVVGAAARNFIRTGNWGQAGVVECIALITRQELLQYRDLPFWGTPPSRGPIPIEIQINNHNALAYVTCIPPTGPETELLNLCLKQRGFRIEALAIDSDGILFDPHQSLPLLEENPYLMFEDHSEQIAKHNALHLIGIGRIAAETGLMPPHSLVKLATKYATRVLYAPRHGWFRELTAILCGSHVVDGLNLLCEMRILGLLLPEIQQMIGFAESSRYHHKDLWDHTLQVINQTPALPLVRWAALLHDVGKIWTRTYANQGEVHFFQHEEMGAIIVEGIGARLSMCQDFQEKLAFLVRYHLRPNAYQKDWNDSAIRRMLKEVGDLIDPLLALSQADLTSGNPKRRHQATLLSNELKLRIAEIQELDRRMPPLPKGIGNRIIEVFHLQPGPRIGSIKQFLESHIESNQLDAHRDIDYYIDYLKQLPHIPE
jgi:poly(A) polymerase